MKNKLSIIILSIFLVGCHSHYPTWTKATPYQQEMGFFTPDEAFYHSAQYTNDIKESVDTIIRLQKQRSDDMNLSK